MGSLGRTLLAILLPLRHYETMTGWINVFNAVPYLGVGLIVATEWYKGLHWHWWLISSMGLIAVLSAHGLYHLQRKVDRLSEFDEAIRQLREAEHGLEGVINNLEAISVAREHPKRGDHMEGHYHDQEEQWKAKGKVIIDNLVEYGLNNPLIGNRIEHELAAPYANYMTGYEHLPYEAAKLAWARDRIGPIIERLSNQAIAHR